MHKDSSQTVDMDQPGNETATDKDFPDRQCRLILIGKTGSGKSSTGNTILGRPVFAAQTGINSETKECGFEETTIDDLTVLVMDTPGLCDTEGEDDIIKQRIARSLYGVAPGPHAVILILRCDRRFTAEEYQVIQALKEAFGKKMTDYLIVIFAGKDALGENAEKVLDSQLQNADKLNKLLTESHRRYILFDNRETVNPATRQEQVAKLIGTVRDVVKHNHGSCFIHSEARGINMSMVKMIKEELRVKTDRQCSAANGFPTNQSSEQKTQKDPQIVKEADESAPKNLDGRELTQTGVDMNSEDKTYTAVNEGEDALSPVMKELQNMITKGKVKMHRELYCATEIKPPIITRCNTFPRSKKKEVVTDQKQNWVSPASTPQEHARLVSDTEGPSCETKSTDDTLLSSSIQAVSMGELPLNSDAETYSASTSTLEQDRDSDLDALDVSIEESVQDTDLAPHAGQWLKYDSELGPLLKKLVGASDSTVEKETQKVEDDLRRKLAIAPLEELSPVQRECLDKSATSAGNRLKKGMDEVGVKSINKCHVM